jgi:hypothetical protein
VVTFIDAIVSWKRKKKWSCLEEWNPTFACMQNRERSKNLCRVVRVADLSYRLYGWHNSILSSELQHANQVLNI